MVFRQIVLSYCVAGVNRSPFVVVWWLVKYHNVGPEKAWDLVRKRRDVGVCWINQTLGGPVNVVDGERCVKQKWFEELKLKFSKT